MTTETQAPRFRSFDFFAGDELYVEGTLAGYARCFTAYAENGDPYHAYSEPVADLATLVAEHPTCCAHIVLLVDDVSPAWDARACEYRAQRVGMLVYPPLAEDGMVVPVASL